MDDDANSQHAKVDTLGAGLFVSNLGKALTVLVGLSRGGRVVRRQDSNPRARVPGVPVLAPAPVRASTPSLHDASSLRFLRSRLRSLVSLPVELLCELLNELLYESSPYESLSV